MGRIEFSAENKVSTSNYDFPRLRLENGERARVVLLESPVVEYVHTLQKPQIINGVPQMVTETKRDGSEYRTNKMDFVARPLCLGDFDVLSTSGIDPDKCPMCALHVSNPDWVRAPQRRYAVHLIRYKTKGGSFDIITPYSIEVVVWAFTDRVFNQIVDLKEEWGDLRQHDLLFGPCENKTFQKFEINVGAKAEWLLDDQRKAVTLEMFKNNQIPDLAIAAGSRKELRWINEDLAQIKQAWTIIAGATAVATEEIGNTSLSEDLSSLLGDSTPTEQAPATSEAPVAETKAPEAPAASASTSEAPNTTADFDDLLSGI